MIFVIFGDTRQYTWRSFNPLVQRRLDYYLISNHLQPLVTSSKICNAISTNHSAILLSICTLSDTEKGPSSLLDDKNYVENIKLNIDLWKAEYTGESSKTRWEFIKFKIREFTILKYSKEKVKEFKTELKKLEENVSKYEVILRSNNNSEEIVEKYKRSKVKVK